MPEYVEVLFFFGELGQWSVVLHQIVERQHQTMIERAWQIIQMVARWLHHHTVVLVADSSFAVIELPKRVSDLKRASLIVIG